MKKFQIKLNILMTQPTYFILRTNCPRVRLFEKANKVTFGLHEH